MVVSGTLYTPEKYHKAYRCLLAAKYSNAKVKTIKYVPGETDSDPSFTSKFPQGEVPCFSGDDGTNLFDANAIAHYLGNSDLRGGKQEHLVSQWANYTDNVIMPSIAVWVYPVLGVGSSNKNDLDKAKENIVKVMQHLNSHLKTVTYLVGERITQADLTVFTALQLLFIHVFDVEARKPFPHVVRWFETIANQSEVTAICGKTVLCAKASQAVAGKKKAGQPQQSKPKEEKKAAMKEEKPKEEPKKEKKKNLVAELPAGNFVMDEWKRMYSNNDLDTVALPWFLEHYEPEFYSIWYCEYNYPQQLKLIFQSNNLIGGMFQRLESGTKYLFAGQHVFGENKNNQISGVWLMRGTDLIFKLSEDLSTDYESYTWRKLDVKDPKDLKIIRDHWKGEGKYHDREYADGKIFK